MPGLTRHLSLLLKIILNDNLRDIDFDNEYSYQ